MTTMAGISLVADLLKRRGTTPTGFSVKSVFPHGVLSATVAASIAGITASRGILSDGGSTVAFCDAGVAWKDDNIPDLRSASEIFLLHESIKYTAKQYPIELKPLYSAFGLKTFAMTSLRSFLLFYLPLMEPRRPGDDDEEDDDTLQASESLDLRTPFEKSVKQIGREVTVTTTRRILERLAVHYVSRRMAWKLLKDVPRSAKRKAQRGWSTPFFFYSVCRTTFRGQTLAVLATWLAQIGFDIYHCLFSKPNDGDEELDNSEKLRRLGKKALTSTGRCCASLVFASIIGGIGAFFHPSFGQYIGCTIGDLAGPFVITICLEKYC